MTFYNYMMRNYRGGTGPKSDLAWNMYVNRKDFPKSAHCRYDGWHRLLMKILQDNGADDDTVEVFEDSWTEYVEHERERKKH